jgi:hypothetical protein
MRGVINLVTWPTRAILGYLINKALDGVLGEEELNDYVSKTWSDPNGS